MGEGLFQPMHLLLILAIALLLFGPKRLPEIGKGIGDGIRALKEGMKEQNAKRTPRRKTRPTPNLKVKPELRVSFSPRVKTGMTGSGSTRYNSCIQDCIRLILIVGNFCPLPRLWTICSPGFRKLKNLILQFQIIRRNSVRRYISVGLIFLFSMTAFADQIVLKNGDKLTGSITKSDGKTLVLKTDYAGDLTIKFDAIQSLSSTGELNVTAGGKTRSWARHHQWYGLSSHAKDWRTGRGATDIGHGDAHACGRGGLSKDVASGMGGRLGGWREPGFCDHGRQ